MHIDIADNLNNDETVHPKDKLSETLILSRTFIDPEDRQLLRRMERLEHEYSNDINSDLETSKYWEYNRLYISLIPNPNLEI